MRVAASLQLFFISVLSAFACMCMPSLAFAQCVAGEYTDTVDGYTLSYRIPTNFNGTLLVYAEGYDDNKVTGSYAQTSWFLGDASIAQSLSDAGYLLAAADYSLPDANCQPNGDYCQPRWAFAQGVASSAAIPARVAALQPGCNVQHSLITGADMGGLVALAVAEDPVRSSAFDGALAMCAPAAGVSRWADEMIDYASAFYVAQNGTLYDGTLAPNNIPWPYDPRVVGSAWPQVREFVDEGNGELANLEFQRFTSQRSDAIYYDGPRKGAVFEDARLATRWLGDLQQQVGGLFGPLETLYGGSPGYSLSSAALDRLKSLDMSNIQALNNLNVLNHLASNLQASESAREQLHALGEVTGDLQIPTIVLNGIADNEVGEWHVAHYEESVAASSQQSRLFAAFHKLTGHCPLPSTQATLVLEPIAALESWITTNTRPDANAFTNPAFNIAHVPQLYVAPRTNIWPRDITSVPQGNVFQHVDANVLRSDARHAHSVTWHIAPADATSAADDLASGTLVFPINGATTLPISVDLNCDALPHADATVVLSLRAASAGANVIQPHTQIALGNAATCAIIFKDGFEG